MLHTIQHQASAAIESQDTMSFTKLQNVPMADYMKANKTVKTLSDDCEC